MIEKMISSFTLNVKSALHYLMPIVYATLLLSCDIKKNTPDNTVGFTKVYDNNSSLNSYTSIDIKEMPDGGFLILGYTEKNNGGVYIMRTDSHGIFLWEKVFTDYINPISELLKVGNDFYFFCIAYPFSSGTILFKINDDAQSADVIKSFNDNLKPLAASTTPDNGFIIQKYDAEKEKTVLVKLNSSFDFDLNFDKDGKKEYSIQITDAIDDRINNHLLHQGETLPFFTGYIGGTSATYYFLNGFYKTDLSTLIVDINTGEIIKRLTGYKYQKAASSFCDLGNGNVSYTRFEYENNFLMPLLSLNSINAISGNSDFGGLLFNELEIHATIKSKKMNINGKELLIMAGNTKGNTVGIFGYEALSGNFSGATYLGSTYPYKLGNFIQTADGGMAVLTHTLVLGKFSRICLFKLTNSELSRITN